ncbi:Hypothetical_protein [Hexamita inflata]|uniref:Hypothetical_protein n=1 Tax=Hexamita inflata TaxID=28002 RepID=A0AA86PZS0_9EUKA|nr:Hypothetical protein HINF_LOCUS37100 [Hexamita inflata]
MLSVGSELASQSQRESARLEVQPLLDPNKHTSEVQANQRNDHTTDNDEYESVSVIERPVGPLPESNMISESIPAARDLSLEPKQSKNSPSCPLIESNFYKNLVETLQKYPLEWDSTVQVSQDRLMNKNTNGASISEQNNHENIDQTTQRLQNTLINVAGVASSTREQQGTLQSSQQSDGTTSSYTKPLNIDILQQVQQKRRITIQRNPVPLHHAEQIQQQEPIPQPSATNQPTTTTEVPTAPTIPEPTDQPVVNNQPTTLQPPQPAVPQTASNNSTTKKFQCSECNIEPCSFPTLKGLYGHAHSLTNHPTHPHHPEKIAEQYRTAINALHTKAQCRICGSPFSTKGNCTTHEKQTPYCREKIEWNPFARQLTLCHFPWQNMQLQILFIAHAAASVQIRISQLSTKHTTNYTTISSVLKQKLHRILTDSLVNSNSKNPNRRNTPSFWKKTSQLKFVNCDQQSPGNLLFKLQAKLFKDLKTTTTMFQGCSSQNKKHLRNLSVSIRIQRTFSSLRCQPAS